MPAPKDRSQLTPWLKQHGYQWVLKASGGAIVSVAEAIEQIENKERENEMAMFDVSDPFMISGVYYTEAVEETGHVWMGQHDDDTGEFEFFMTDPVNTEEKDGVRRYTLPDGTVFIQHKGMLMTEWEHKGEPRPPRPPRFSFFRQGGKELEGD